MLAWRQLNDLEETVTYDVIIRDGLGSTAPAMRH